VNIVLHVALEHTALQHDNRKPSADMRGVTAGPARVFKSGTGIAWEITALRTDSQSFEGI
jgi:hypothetical protein